MNVFDCAIKIEEETKEYFEGLRKVAEEPEMQTLFSILAASEDEHKERLMRLKEKADGPAMETLDHGACSFRPVLSQRELMEEAERDPNLYRFAVANEEEEIRFYEELAARAPDDRTRRSLMMLADEERCQLQRIENIYSFVEAPKSFLEWGEFSNLREL